MDQQHTPLRAVQSIGQEGIRFGRISSPALQLRCMGPVLPRFRQLASCSAGTGVESHGPLWPTRIEMGQGFVNDSSRLRKNGPPLSCFRIILLSNLSAGRSFASVPEVEPPSTAVQMQRSSARLDGCARSAEEGGPPAPHSLPVCGSCDAVAARVLNVCVRDFARARRRRAPSPGSPSAEEICGRTSPSGT